MIKKRIPVDAQAGLFIECLLLLPFGLACGGSGCSPTGWGMAFATPAGFGWALLNGPATVLPLALFAWAARRMPLSTMGFIQFLAPTLQFGVGAGDGRAFTPLRAVSFAFIWLGAGVFAAAALFRARAARAGDGGGRATGLAFALMAEPCRRAANAGSWSPRCWGPA